MTIHAFPDRIVLEDEAFTTDLTIYTPPTGYRIVVKSYRLSLSGATANVHLRFGASNYFGSFAGVTVAYGFEHFERSGIRYSGNKDEALVAAGGFASCVLNGDFEIELVKAD